MNFETWLSIFSTILLNSSEVAASSVDAALLSLADPSSFYNSFIFRMNLSSQIFVIEGTNSFQILTVDIFYLLTRTGETTRTDNLDGKLK